MHPRLRIGVGLRTGPPTEESRVPSDRSGLFREILRFSAGRGTPIPRQAGAVPVHWRRTLAVAKPRMPDEVYRIKRLPPYVFAEVNALKAQARGERRDVIDLGMGNPDGPTPPHIVAKLIEAVQNPKTHGYSSSRGIAGLRPAQAPYYPRPFKCELA